MSRTKTNSHKIKKKELALGSENTSTINKKTDKTRTTLIAMLSLLAIFTLVFATAVFTISPENSRMNDFDPFINSAYGSENNFTNFSTGSHDIFTIALHLRTHVYTMFSQPVTATVNNMNGQNIGDPELTTTVVSPLKEKIVYINIPFTKFGNDNIMKICLTNERNSKFGCDEQMIEPGSLHPQIIHSYMTVP